MKQITDYQMVAATKGKDLEALIKEKLADGWQPYEAPFIMEIKEAYQPLNCIVQTMVKYKDN
jgi:hypothetical protein